jgi:glycosyltransferase involved in cell wall biosynthesis
MDLIIVPSEFVKKIIFESGRKVTVPVVVIPESFPDKLLENDIPQLDLDLDTSFNFLIFGQFTGNNPENDRKNLFYTIKWLCETFSNDPDVGFIIKTNVGRNSKIDQAATKNMLTKLIAEIKQSPFPKIHLLHGTMSDTEVAGLYRHPKIKAQISLHRGESFGLTLLEAAASGLPVIATDWSATTEFLGDKYIKLNYSLKEIHESRIDNQIFLRGAKWAEVSEEDVKQKLLKFKSKPDLPTTWAKELQKIVQSSHSFKNISNQYDILVSSILK